ncbi:hypothetical protein MCOR27_003189 [Pyricularia oryzae]|nr:hypothetical protein MCOR02_007717 [Pyricularia oryzae]KAI6283593.1 hypothetical protein MCOR27_003189 [Pyricularia oryzae]KAI6335776.1 hypothetical protein MCOR28_009496 [Pyricularia oryzae]KAI6352353.1 hypothetical protein MCOR32_011330 [Pyricularia oryzae]KAI6447139.1 hypothetical protein MCOR22_003467 [Pyricularia oryzae]
MVVDGGDMGGLSSGMLGVNHLESDTCPSAQNISRDDFYRRVHSRDPQGVISKTLIDWNGEAEYEATVHPWNGSGYECHLCHRVLQEIHNLDQHLKSPTRSPFHWGVATISVTNGVGVKFHKMDIAYFERLHGVECRQVGFFQKAPWRCGANRHRKNHKGWLAF